MRSPEPALAPRVHGGVTDDERRAHGELVDFSASCNPYGPTAAMRAAIHAAPIDRYPDPTAAAARRALASRAGAAIEELALGNGACELLWTIARALLRPGAPVVIAEPTFGELRAAATAAGAIVHTWRATAPDFAIDLHAIAALARARDAALLSLCTPNTPTGATVPAADVAALAAALPATTIVLDQSFLALGDGAADLAVAMPPNVIRVRSLTKDHGIPGVRVGYLLAPRRVVERVEAGRAAWTTSAAAQAAAIASAAEAAFVADSRAALRADRDALAAALRGLGLVPLPSSAPFLLVPVRGAAAARARLIARGVVVRDAASFGLPDHVRVAARPAADRARLIAALAAELAR